MNISPAKRITLLAALGEVVFHAEDLANLWNIQNENTLHTTLSRYVKSGVLYRIYNGLYSLKKMSDLDPHLLGLKALHAPGYVSCESVLYDHGILNQPPQEITLVGTKSKRFGVAGYRFRSRQLSDTYLYNDAGIEMNSGVRIATVERAILDLWYFHPKKYLDARESGLIDWEKVKDMATLVGYTIPMPKNYVHPA